MAVRVAVLGAGSFGSCLAILCADRGHDVTLWARDAGLVDSIARERRNPRFLKEIEFPATIRPTTHADPTYLLHGVIHYAVTNMPALVPRTATFALTNATLPYVDAIADHGLAEAVARDAALARGVNVVDGKITYEAVAEAHGLDYYPLDDVLPLSPV